MMENRRLNKIECFHVVGMHESERFKVTALNLWEASHLLFDRPLPGKPPTPPPLPVFKKPISYITTQSLEGEGGVGSIKVYCLCISNY